MGGTASELCCVDKAPTCRAVEITGPPATARELRGPDSPGFGEEHWTARQVIEAQLLSAAREGHLASLLKALEDGANVDTRIPLRMVVGLDDRRPDHSLHPKLRRRACVGLTPLMLAAQSGCSQCARALLEAHADPDAREEDHMRPLHFAVISGSLMTARLLIGAMADPELRDRDHRKPLDYLPKDVLQAPPELDAWMELPLLYSESRRKPAPCLEAGVLSLAAAAARWPVRANAADDGPRPYCGVGGKAPR